MMLPLPALAQSPELPTKWTASTMAAEIPHSAYPRPQFRRTDWLCLNGWWAYKGGKDLPSAKSPRSPVSFAQGAEKIHVPFCPESVLSGIKRKQEINMWYQRSFDVPPAWSGKRLLLHFEGVDHDATVLSTGK